MSASNVNFNNDLILNRHYSINEDSTILDPKKLSERLIAKIDQFNIKVEQALPAFLWQSKLDSVGAYIEKQFAPLAEFNQWLNKNDAKAWYAQLATALYKLPMRIIRNIIKILYNQIKQFCFSIVHPLQAVSLFAKMLITLAEALTDPKVWPHMGAGVVGTGFGTGLVPTLAFGIAAAMIVGGLSFTIISEGTSAAYLEAQKLPEIFLTSLCMGMLAKSIKKAYRKYNNKFENSNEVADAFISKNKLPNYAESERFGSDRVGIRWNHERDLESGLDPRFSKLFEKIQFQIAPTDKYQRNSFIVLLRQDGSGLAGVKSQYNECITCSLDTMGLKHSPFSFTTPAITWTSTASFKSREEAKPFVHQLLTRRGLVYSRMMVDSNGRALGLIIVDETVRKTFPKLFERNSWYDHSPYTDLRFAIRPDGTGYIGSWQHNEVIGSYQRRISLTTGELYYSEVGYTEFYYSGLKVDPGYP